MTDNDADRSGRDWPTFVAGLAVLTALAASVAFAIMMASSPAYAPSGPGSGQAVVQVD